MKHELRQIVANHKLVVGEDTIRLGTCLVIGDQTFIGNIVLQHGKRLICHKNGYGNPQAYLYVYELVSINT